VEAYSADQPEADSMAKRSKRSLEESDYIY
jgi:hypothetical protein